MLSKSKIYILLSLILLLIPAKAAAEERDSIIVSLITCAPGAEIYELCGHEAVRVRGEGIDSVWNYGVFDYNEPNFVYRFVKGETDYMLAGYPFRYFLPEYMVQGRKVTEQDLNLTQAEAHRLLALLRREALPENRTYRYNYVRDNCATRIVDRIAEAADTAVIYPDSAKYGTFRNTMRAYHKDYPWYQFGIDMALGSGLDVPISGREEMFVPLEMMEKAAGAHFADGRPFVSATRVLVEGVPDATLGPTHWSAAPMACSAFFFLMVLVVCFIEARKKMIFRSVYSVWFLLCGLAGIVETFLVFVSEHEATSPNILLLWLNPLQLIIAVAVWCGRRGRPFMTAMSYYNIIVVGIMLIVWPFQPQSANPAFFPLMGATVALSVAYAIIAPEISYNKDNKRINEKVRNLGAGGSRRHGSDGRRPGVASAARGRNRR